MQLAAPHPAAGHANAQEGRAHCLLNLLNEPGRERGCGRRGAQVHSRSAPIVRYYLKEAHLYSLHSLSYAGFELVDMHDHLPGLIYRPGLSSWRPTVTREINTEFATYEGYIQSLDESQRGSSKMLESHWPPSPQEAESLHLSRWSVSVPPIYFLTWRISFSSYSLRIYPHLQDTGGFFVAILQKKPPVRVPSTTSASKDASYVTLRSHHRSSLRRTLQRGKAHGRCGGRLR